ncbi:hypothetical protein F66182_9386 [Fusarium sp. NRRL 66182]|nr:hypothetical protein F66182_9386 [Fusarium sp. NRRL 66182]
MVSAPSGAAVLGVNFTLIILAALVIAARVYLRLVIQRQRLIVADWLRILAWFSAFIVTVFVAMFEKQGVMEAHIDYTLANWDVEPEKRERVMRNMWARIIPYFTTFYLCKASLLVVYLQLFPPFMKKRRATLLATIVLCILAYIVSICLQLFICFPIERNWSSTEPEKLCDRWTVVITFQVAWALHISTSLALFVLPFLVLYKLNLRPQVKLGVYGIFLLGLIDIAFSLTRFLTIQLSNSKLWSTLDAYIGLIIACLPALKPYLHSKGSRFGYDESGRNVNSAPAVRRTAPSGFEEIDETPSSEAGAEAGPWNVSHVTSYETKWNDGKSNRSDVELVSLEAKSPGNSVT